MLGMLVKDSAKDVLRESFPGLGGASSAVRAEAGAFRSKALPENGQMLSAAWRVLTRESRAYPLNYFAQFSIGLAEERVRKGVRLTAAVAAPTSPIHAGHWNHFGVL